ncbi:phage tail protein [Mucilaginibacter jinjuensis]|uniref:Tail fiber protein n=1 Tax=Mucilaginibacter jinjuensis TaxID=1176721 RepID=A0ABY7TCY0_9SPHI|nr:tail fiber protein [Mucilaginibacter jinjuensis]WCT14068.1 tail fiber protein [Mucilaginibacter jinjuensis]
MTPYVGEIRAFAGNFAPANWHICDGSLMSIASNEVLFTLLGTTYGGDGVQTFGLPDLRGRIIVNQGRARSGTNYPLGMPGGAETVTLTTTTMPGHSHAVNVSTQAGTTTSPANNFFAAPTDPTATNPQTVSFYMPANAPGFTVHTLAAGELTPSGGSQPHENRMPYLTISYIISLYGVFPSSN